MRITNALQTRDIIRRLATNSSRLTEAQEKVATGLKVQRMSDDPTSGTAIMQASSGLRSLEQFQRNVGKVGSQLDAEDTALDQITQILTRAKELAVSQSGGNADARSRTSAAAEVKALIGQVVSIGNTTLGDDFLFGGANSPDAAPFDQTQTGASPRYVSIATPDALPRVPRGVRQMEIASGQTMAGAHDGETVFVNSRVLESLDALHEALLANSESGIAGAMTVGDEAFARVQSLVGEVGARRNQVDTVAASLEAFQANLQLVKSDLSEVDMEQAITEMMARQTAYQAAMLASSKVMGMSLTDYLR